MSSSDSELLTVAQVAALLGRSSRSVERMRAAGVIGSTPIGLGSRPRVYFTQSQVDDYLRSQAQPATTTAQRRTRSRETKTRPPEQQAS